MGMDTVELVLIVERDFDIQIPDKEAERITTVGLLYDAVLSKLNAKNIAVDKEQVWEKLQMIFVNEFGLRRSQIVPEAGIVKDLGLD